MTPERWQEIKSLLDACADLDAERRSTWLEQACGGDTALRQEVESYLSHEDELDAFSKTPAAGALLDDETVDYRGEVTADDADHVGRLVGSYRVESLLDSGGMGAVYRARRDAEFEQRVALKLVRPSVETPELLERFQNERQILARLEHPNIARLLDGGTSDEGHPYFVMELIEGVPIDRYCDRHRLPVRARLELVLQVCDALRYAHRNLVLHRDLKPSNILVTEDGIPKLLDFGIAKVLRKEIEPATEPAEGLGPMTVSYASPEQLHGEAITTASDLYSLGVLIYELLTGRLPCGAAGDSAAMMAWAICHQDPTPPSTVVRPRDLAQETDLGAPRPEAVADTRERSPSALHRRLRGDVDAILLEALRKDPADRYGSVGALARDLRRYLDGLPVAARRGGLAYRAGKYARRHRLMLTAAGLILATILSFTVALSRQLERTERQRARSERLSGFLVDLFGAASPDRAGDEPSVRELVDIGRERLETELEDEPEVRADLLGTLGQVYYRLGHYNDAREAQETSIEILRQQLGPDHPHIARALNDLVAVAHAKGDHQQAESYSRDSIAMRQRLDAEADLVKSRNNLAALLLLRGKLDEAEAIYRESLTSRREAFGDRHRNVAVSLSNLATVLLAGGDFDAAEPLLRESLEIRLELYGRDSAPVARVLASLGRLAHARGDFETAEPLYLEALDIRRHRLGPEHLNVAVLEKDLASLLLDRGDPGGHHLDTARILLAHAYGPIYRHKPEGDWWRADLESIYGAYLAARGHLAEAEVCLSEGYRAMEEVRGPDVLPSRVARQRLADFERYVSPSP